MALLDWSQCPAVESIPGKVSGAWVFRDTFKNGDLLTAAEAAGFDVLITTDKNMRYQQNLTSRTIAIVVLGNAQWPVLRLHVAQVVAAVNGAAPGSFTEVDIPID